MRYKYKGNVFQLEKESRWTSRSEEYAICGMEINTPVLELPDRWNGCRIRKWSLPDRKYPEIRKICIPDSITSVSVSNQFPDLESVEVDPGNPEFSTEGKMLLSKEKKELILCLAEGNQEKAAVPKSIRRIGRGAFSGSGCREICFENPDVSVDSKAFSGSVWEKEQGVFCVVGNLFYSLNRETETLCVPDGIRRFHEEAFAKHSPIHLITPVMPSRGCAAWLGERRYSWSAVSGGRCRKITITSKTAAVPLLLIRQVFGLEELNVSPDHREYCSVDGVLFTKNRKCLVYYPKQKKDGSYTIPETVVKIGRSAFENQKHLKTVIMPDTVKKVEPGAFYGCEQLESVRLSASIREIPDDSVYQRGGVFSHCLSLKKIELPENLQYLGSYAFAFSGLERITLNQKLRQIGPYALAASGLKEITLPPSLERIGPGALFYAKEVHACVGTAKGLLAAVNTTGPGESEKLANVQWGRCVVHAYHRTGSRVETFLIPESLKRNAACHLDAAWNQDSIDYEEYDACFDAITDSEEKLEFAQLGILRLQGVEDSPYVSYMKHSAMKIASGLVRDKREKELLVFLQTGYLSEQALEKVLKLSNKNNLTTVSAYILNEQNKSQKRKKRSLML